MQGEMEKAQVLLEKAQLLVNELPLPLKASLYSNISCYYEKINDDRTAMLYLEQAI